MTPGGAQPASELERTRARRRVLGHVAGTRPGPTLVCVAGLHGNEPAGVEAVDRVFAVLDADPPPLRGEVIALAGNLAALAQRRRYIVRDLNRAWAPQRVRALRREGHAPDAAAEEREQWELLLELDRIFEGADDEIFVLDLHTTSGEGAPFVTLGDTLRNRAFARHFPVPVVLGLEEHLNGTLDEYLDNRGTVTLGYEAGQHESAAAVEHSEAAIWIALAASGVIPADLPRVRLSRERLQQTSEALPHFLEVRYRHPVEPEDTFRMEPGFRNFQRLQPGALLARDRHGEIRSQWQGRILMPLYQELGEDGFFVVREFSPFWLTLSAWLRRIRLDALVHWLPGVVRHPQRPDTLVADRRIARWSVLPIFHLLGFRKQRALGDKLVLSRRRHDPHR